MQMLSMSREYKKKQKYDNIAKTLRDHGIKTTVDAFVVGSMENWDTENEEILKSIRIIQKTRALAFICVMLAISWGRYVFYTLLHKIKYIREPKEAEAQIQWLKRLLIEDKEASREWLEMGRLMPDRSEVPPSRKRLNCCVRVPNYFWANPDFLAGRPQEGDRQNENGPRTQNGEVLKVANERLRNVRSEMDCAASEVTGGCASTSRSDMEVGQEAHEAASNEQETGA